MEQEHTITLKLEFRDDGGLRVWSDDLHGLILSHQDVPKVIEDIGTALPIFMKAWMSKHHTAVIKGKSRSVKETP